MEPSPPPSWTPAQHPARQIPLRPQTHGQAVHQGFKVAIGQESCTTETATMGHDLRKPTCTFHMVPDVTFDCLASTSKMCDARYFTVFDGEEVRIYDAETTKVATSKPPVLKGWCDVVSNLWRIPLTKQAPGPDSGHLTNRAPGTRPTSWDQKMPLTSRPLPQRNNC